MHAGQPNQPSPATDLVDCLQLANDGQPHIRPVIFQQTEEQWQQLLHRVSLQRGQGRVRRALAWPGTVAAGPVSLGAH